MSQDYNISNKPQISQKKHIYHTVIGQSEYGLFTVNYTDDYFSGGFSIEHYDQDLGFVDEKNIKLPSKTKVLDIFHGDSSIYWVTLSKKRKEKLRLSIFRISCNLDGEAHSQFLGHIPLKDWNPDDIRFSYDMESRLWSLGVLYESKTSETIFWSEVRDTEGHVISKFEDTLSERFHTSALVKFKLGHQGEVLALIQYQKPKAGLLGTQKSVGLYVFRGNKKKSGFDEWKFEEQPLSTVVYFDGFRKEWSLLALFGAASKEVKGISILKLNQEDDSVWQNDQFFDAKIAANLESGFGLGKRKTPAIINFVCRRFVPQRDGGGVLLMERYHELKQLETYYLNGIPQTATRLIYHFDEIGAIFLNSKGTIDTVVKIEKEQAAAPTASYLLGFGSFVCDDGVHVVFNGDISKNNEIKHIIVRPDFSVESHTLMISDNFYNAVVPFDGMETDYCTFTLPLLRDKQWFWMQVKRRD